ncbi:helix-turn-helix domain-containing protein [Microbacterium halotolerans]|uniref:helix-turn-helix domain-containing protein n=1 Tax=Microbacterium halotolerans TaxID=246613 RepID=UPI000E6ACCD4|nr:helix-turn-helix domain-containing protein [Microbacterium halotolerans]
MTERLLKVMEAAKLLGVGRDWVHKRIELGEIPVVELGDTRKNQRIREADLKAFIERRTFGRDRRGPRAM